MGKNKRGDKMNPFESGKLIAKLRKEAGYTQKSLAEALFITDKAVSKWERGVCLPDSSLLTRLSMLLDADIEYLISGKTPYGEHKWVGELRADNLDAEIAGKPLIHYLLSYFMLVGITDIAIITNDKEYVRRLDLKKYGLNISFTSQNAEKTMIIYSKFLLFGVNITRQFQHCMSAENNIITTLHGQSVPVLFTHGYRGTGVEGIAKKAVVKSLGRGTVYIPISSQEEMRDASQFVEIYEKYHNVKVADLNEIAILRGLV